ncbi:hypothetical protein LSP04_13950 [Levilactobacillus spicheri]|uniref:Uncharacterized protein n=1 Tax=Levilactobacillus spicheri TaxID=216463 RepID=A0ABQ0WPH5_9LACO|nr:hypothetical protein LSP04_13950 [Levilactobacillus spicheri]
MVEAAACASGRPVDVNDKANIAKPAERYKLRFINLTSKSSFDTKISLPKGY